MKIARKDLQGEVNVLFNQCQVFNGKKLSFKVIKLQEFKVGKGLKGASGLNRVKKLTSVFSVDTCWRENTFFLLEY